jgi:hypothetical protein
MQAARWGSRWPSGRGHAAGCETAADAASMTVGELLARLQRPPRDAELPAMAPGREED